MLLETSYKEIAHRTNARSSSVRAEASVCSSEWHRWERRLAMYWVRVCPQGYVRHVSQILVPDLTSVANKLFDP